MAEMRKDTSVVYANVSSATGKEQSTNNIYEPLRRNQRNIEQTPQPNRRQLYFVLVAVVAVVIIVVVTVLFSVCTRGTAEMYDPDVAECPKVKHVLDTFTEIKCVHFWGPYGTKGGIFFSDYESHRDNGSITTMVLNTDADGYLGGIGFFYGQHFTYHGKGKGTRTEKILQSKDSIVKLQLWVSKFVDKMRVYTKQGQVFGPSGRSRYDSISYTVENGGKPLMFISGRTGGLIDSLSFYFSCD